MNLFTLSWKNLIHKPLSLLLSLVLFALGVGLISLLLLLNTQIEDKFEKNLAGIDLVIGAKGSPLQMILSSMYHIDSPTGNISIKDIRPFLNPKHPLIRLAVPLSLGDNHQGYRIIGTSHRFVDSLYNGQLAKGKLWEVDFEVSIGAAVAKALALKIGDTFHSSHGLVNDGMNMHDDTAPFKVVGIFAASGSVLDQLILTDTRSIWKVHAHAAPAPGSDEHDHEQHAEHDHPPHEEGDAPKALIDETDKHITSVLIRYRNQRDWRALNMPRNINENTDLQAAGPAFELNRLRNMMGNGERLLRSLALIIVIVSGLSIFISLYNSLKERKYELALMRVMGASRFRLFILIVLEGLVLAVLGYLLGILVSHIGMELFAGYMEDSYRYSFTGKLFLKEEWYLLGAALLIGFLAAVIPAIQAFRTDISATLTDS